MNKLKCEKRMLFIDSFGYVSILSEYIAVIWFTENRLQSSSVQIVITDNSQN